MRNNNPINIYGNGEQIRDFIYVENIANICIEAIKANILSNNKAYNLLKFTNYTKLKKGLELLANYGK